MDGFFNFVANDVGEEPPSSLSLEDVMEAIREIKQVPERPVRLVGRKYDVYDLLIDLGCLFEVVDDRRVPAPVAIGTLSMDVVEDEQSPPGLVREEFADGRTGRSYLRSPAKYGTGAQWFVVDAGHIVDQFRADRS